MDDKIKRRGGLSENHTGIQLSYAPKKEKEVARVKGNRLAYLLYVH